ncbi:MAG: undecaprenyldiphospho-muramoylpentapeptide beta-N-acetylglucosaminyltransferase [Candidatus Hydrogenedentes bacterium]|nr:undecaprenyldiphospho-muramoylpentapeptide beta-N-acetylglucosaminyltransferase [Candidatus Hydrogenedentota bacterium]
MRVIITGGGTGGHTSPGLAILEELEARDPDLRFHWLGKSNSYESRLCARRHIPFRSIPVAPWPRKNKLKRAAVLVQLALGAIRSWMYLRKLRPHAVIGVGGYVSLPLMWTAQRMGLPTYVHEQNKRMGMANRVLAPRATRVFLSYPGTHGDFPGERALLVGNPVRAGFFTPPPKHEARHSLAFAEDGPLVFFCGGSQGAASMNEAVGGALTRLIEHGIHVLWMTGPAHVESCRNRARAYPDSQVQVVPFVENMVEACAAADLLVMRAGASTIAEIAALGQAALLVPYPHATDGHQLENAQALAAAGAALVLEEVALNSSSLAAAIDGLLGNPDRLRAMGAAARALAHPNAAGQIVEQLLMDTFGRASSA